ncbi:MAG TPA: hypothetical protein VLD18_12450, partial [Verrucomicrobiae bacterium]|nr:hypothetical protein [Verrucomicrobiae bacterium]
ASVSFTNPGEPATTATFPQAGHYRLRLSAQDGTSDAWDEIDVTVHETAAVNQPPRVDAGPDQFIATPTTALRGTAIDDGLPAGATPTYAWSLVSGPGSVLFTSSQSLATLASFGGPGIYTLRLTVRDGSLAGTDDVAVTVAPNQRPLVTASPDQVVNVAGSVSLLASISDDGLPAGTLTGHWTTISGPGTAAISGLTVTETSVTATASFSLPGRYALRVAISDSELEGHDDTAITVLPDGNQPPIVLPSPDQTIALNESALLPFEVADDGLPQGGLTYRWTRVSGPGDAAFGEVDGIAAVRFNAPGIHVVRLTVDDGERSASAEVTITVLAEKPVLTVDAGPDQVLEWPGAAALTASVAWDGFPENSALNYAWTQTSGPGQVTWTHPEGTVTSIFLAT